MRSKYTLRFLSALLLFTFLQPRQSAAQSVVINEYSCSNLTSLPDAFGKYEDWVELYNTTAAPVSLTGYYLSDQLTNIQKWAIPTGVTIPANGRMMIFCSDRGVFTGGQLHPKFKLTQTKGFEKFILATPLGVIVDSVSLKLTQLGHSRGRTTDGGATWSVFNTPTANAANNNAKTAYMPKVAMSVAPGFYPTAQSIALSCPDGSAIIRYTLDGSDPTATSTLYSAPIAIPTTKVLRARAFSANTQYLPSFTETNTYFINETVASTMNVISVAGPYPTLFGSFSYRLFGAMEFFDKSKTFKFEVDGESRRHGNDSWSYAQKGFRFYARDEMGVRSSMDYKFFGTSPRDTFKVIILKAAGSDNRPGGPQTSAHLRDAFVHTLAEKHNLEMDFRRYEPTVIFINGQYWGLYEIRERVDDDHTEYYYGQPKDKIDMLRYWGGLNIEEGSDTGWVNLYNYIMANPMTVQANYDHVKQFLNPLSLIDYFIINTWLVNTDWLNWNTMWWRGRKSTGVKWRYALWDEDNVMGLGQNYTGVTSTGPDNDPCNPFTLFQNNSTIKHTDMIVRLMQNAEFDKLYRDRFIDMLNGPLNCASLHANLDSMLARITPEMQRQLTRWSGSMATWNTNVQNIRNWIDTRCTNIAGKLDTCMQLKPRALAVNVSPPASGTVKLGGTTLPGPYAWRRIVKADSTYPLQAVPAANYVFSHWLKDSVENTMSPDTLSASVGFLFRKRDSVIAVFRYVNPDSTLMSFNIDTPGHGTIALVNVSLPSYPYTTTLNRTKQYAIAAFPTAGFRFTYWSAAEPATVFTPGTNAKSAKFKYTLPDTIVAHFERIPPVPPPPPPPPLIPVDETVSIPTAFSPNGDGKNDFFQIAYGKDVAAIEWSIYNRYGQQVFHTYKLKERWDGFWNGVPAAVGTYFYTMRIVLDNGSTHKEKTITGDVTLLR